MLLGFEVIQSTEALENMVQGEHTEIISMTWNIKRRFKY